MATSGKYTLEVEAQYTGLVVRPGDKLVIGFSGMLDMSQYHEVKDTLEERLPGVEIVVIDRVTGMAVYRDE